MSGTFVDSLIQDIIVLGIPTPVLPSDYTLCAGTYGLNANYPYGDSYLWSTGATTQFIQYSVPGTYWIQVTNICGVGSDTIHATFIYPPSPVLPTLNYLCPGGDEDTLIAGPDDPNYFYSWIGGATTNYIIVNQPGSYFVQISNQCGFLSAYCNVSYLAPPSVELGTNDTFLCGNSQELTFNVFIPTCADCVYEWSNGVTLPFNIINTEAANSVTISNECGLATDTVNVNLLPIPFYVFGNDTTICNDQELNYHLSLEDGDFLWQDGSTDSNYTIASNGTFYVTQHNHCASLTDTIKVKKLTLGFDFGFTDTLMCRGDKLNFNAAQPEGIYLWNTGSFDSTIEISSEGLYSVNISNYCGTIEDSIEVFYQNCDACVHVPTAFSPNQDGHNDYYRVLHDCLLTAFEIHIYNRWGQEVYSSTDPDLVWDGKFNGEDQEVGAYIFELSYSKSDLKTVTSDYIKGNITLLR